MSAVLQVKQSEFDVAISSDELVLVDFSATWCGPCKRLEPELEAAAEQYAGHAKVIKVDVDESPEIAMRYGVQGIPNMTFFKGGKPVDTIIGFAPRTAIAERIKKNL